MLSTLKTTAVAALLALGVAAIPASASAAPAAAAGALGAASAATQLPVERTDGFSFSYSQGYHGPRYRYARPYYPYHYGGYYYRHPYWQPHYRSYYRPGPSVSFGLSFGGTAQPRYHRGGRGSAHVAWCQDTYRTYDARSDTFIARAGAPRVRCRSPY